MANLLSLAHERAIALHEVVFSFFSRCDSLVGNEIKNGGNPFVKRRKNGYGGSFVCFLSTTFFLVFIHIPNRNTTIITFVHSPPSLISIENLQHNTIWHLPNYISHLTAFFPPTNHRVTTAIHLYTTTKQNFILLQLPFDSPQRNHLGNH